MILRAFLALIACLLALLPPGTLASIPRNAFVPPPVALFGVEFSIEQVCGPLTLHLDGLHDRAGPCDGVLVRQNPWSKFDPEGLAAKEKLGEVYTVVNHESKEIYVGQTERDAEKRLKDSGHPARGLLDKKGTEVYTRDIKADEGWQKAAAGEGIPEESARNRIKLTAERAEFEARTKQFEGYKVLNDQEKLISEAKAKSTKETFGVSRTAKPRSFTSDRGRLRKGVAGGVGAILLLVNGAQAAEEVDSLAAQWSANIAAGDPGNDQDLINHQLGAALTGQSSGPIYTTAVAAVQSLSEKALYGGK